MKNLLKFVSSSINKFLIFLKGINFKFIVFKNI